MRAKVDEVMYTAVYYAASVEISKIYLGKEFTRSIADTKLALHPLSKVFGKSIFKS